MLPARATCDAHLLSSADSESWCTVAVGTTRATRGAPRSPLFFGIESSPYANGVSGVKLDESANLAPATVPRDRPRRRPRRLKCANRTWYLCITPDTVCALFKWHPVLKPQFLALRQRECQDPSKSSDATAARCGCGWVTGGTGGGGADSGGIAVETSSRRRDCILEVVLSTWRKPSGGCDDVCGFGC